MRRIIVAKTLGALIYAPYAVGLGYAVSDGAGHVIERFIGRAEPVIAAAIALMTLAFIVMAPAPAHADARATKKRGGLVRPPPHARKRAGVTAG